MSNPNSKVANIRQMLDEQGIDMLYMAFIGPDGSICSKCSLTGLDKQHMDDLLLDGIAVNGKMLDGWSDIDEAEWLLLIPDLSTVRSLPRDGDMGYACVLGSLRDFPLDARECAERVVGYAAEMDLVPMCGTSACYRLDGLGISPDGKPYGDLIGEELARFNAQVALDLKESGIPVEYFQLLGRGYTAMDLVPTTFLEGLDNCALAKWYIRSVAAKRGFGIEFGVPELGLPMSAVPVHMSVWNREKNRNLFFDGDDALELSGLAKSFIAGIQRHFDELTAIISLSAGREYDRPWSSSYSEKRDESVMHIPVYLLERKKHDRVGWGKRVLFNGFLPGCNLHICASAVMLAGLDGIANSWVPEGNDRRKMAIARPDTRVLEEDSIFRQVLGDAIIDYLVGGRHD